jgi:hypothetical protein
MEIAAGQFVRKLGIGGAGSERYGQVTQWLDSARNVVTHVKKILPPSAALLVKSESHSPGFPVLIEDGPPI